MAVQHFSKVFAVTDCKAYPIIADTSGGTTTYGTAVDVPGIKSLKISGSIETKRLRGDNQLLDADSVLGEVNVAIEYAKLSLDFLALLLDGDVVDSGTSPDSLAEWDLTGDSKPRPFRLLARSASADPIAGSVEFDVWKVTLASFPEMGLSEEDYTTHTVQGALMPRLSDNKILTPRIRETAVPLV